MGGERQGIRTRQPSTADIESAERRAAVLPPPAEGARFELAFPVWETGLANRPGNPYPATFRTFLSLQWTHRESNPDGRRARAVSSRWTMSPFTTVDLMGVEPIAPILQGSVASIGMQARVRLYTGDCRLQEQVPDSLLSCSLRPSVFSLK